MWTKVSLIVIRRLSFKSRQCRTVRKRANTLLMVMFMSKNGAILFHKFNVVMNWQLIFFPFTDFKIHLKNTAEKNTSPLFSASKKLEE